MKYEKSSEKLEIGHIIRDRFNEQNTLWQLNRHLFSKAARNKVDILIADINTIEKSISIKQYKQVELNDNDVTEATRAYDLKIRYSDLLDEIHASELCRLSDIMYDMQSNS
jgi:hypothetical protein